MEDFSIPDYEQEIAQILNQIYPDHEMLFTGMIISNEKGTAHMGARKLKVTGYPYEREHWLFLHVQPGDNSTCLKIKLDIPSNFVVKEVYKAIKQRTPLLRRKKQNHTPTAVKPTIEANPEAVQTELTSEAAKNFLISCNQQELSDIDVELKPLLARAEVLQARRKQVAANLDYLQELA